MAAFKLPRLKANLSVVSGQGKPLDYFLRFWNIEVAPRIENQEASQDQIIAELAEVQEQLAAQLTAINKALELAGLALSQTGNGGTSGFTIDIDTPVWQEGPQVDLTDVVAGDLSAIGSGISVNDFSTVGIGTVNGEIRIVEVIGGVDTVVLGPYPFTITRSVFNCPGIDAATVALATTGAIGYRMDYIYTSGATALGVESLIVVRRSV